jgi:hypothetical protein
MCNSAIVIQELTTPAPMHLHPMDLNIPQSHLLPLYFVHGIKSIFTFSNSPQIRKPLILMLLVISLTVALPSELFVHIAPQIIFLKCYSVIRKLGLGDILTKQAVEDFFARINAN